MSTPVKVILITLSAVVTLGGMGFLAYDSFKSGSGGISLYDYVDEVIAHKEKFIGRKQVQVHGYARKVPEEGRLEGNRIYRDFELERNGKTIWVKHEGVVPDTFKDHSETVVTGQLVEEDGRLVLTTVGGEKGIMAKCPSKYQEGAPRN